PRPARRPRRTGGGAGQHAPRTWETVLPAAASRAIPSYPPLDRGEDRAATGDARWAGRGKAPHRIPVRGLPVCGSRGASASRLRGDPRDDHLVILVTRPEPTVRPPSRMAKPRPSSMAIGWISST